MVMAMINAVLGRTRITVAENERVLVLIRGRFADILQPGQHWVSASGRKVRPAAMARLQSMCPNPS